MEICTQAIKQNSLALQYVKNQTYELCMLAITRPHLSHMSKNFQGKNYKILDCVNEQNLTFELCKAAVDNCGIHTLNYIRDQELKHSVEIYAESIKDYSNNLY